MMVVMAVVTTNRTKMAPVAAMMATVMNHRGGGPHLDSRGRQGRRSRKRGRSGQRRRRRLRSGGPGELHTGNGGQTRCKQGKEDIRGCTHFQNLLNVGLDPRKDRSDAS